MFTGLVEAVGRVESVLDADGGRNITVIAPDIAAELHIGDSIAIDGVCLTVTKQSESLFEVQAVGPTLERTTAGSWTTGRPLNLERSLRADARLGGHFVQGHIDAVGTVLRVQRSGEAVLLDIELPDVVAEVTVLHGSIAIDGVSLTVSALPTAHSVQVALIPHTLRHTNLQRLTTGERVNLEGDLLGRFVVHHLQRQRG